MVMIEMAARSDTLGKLYPAVCKMNCSALGSLIHNVSRYDTNESDIGSVQGGV